MSAFYTELTLLEGRYAKAFYDVVQKHEVSARKTSDKISHALREAASFFKLLKENTDLYTTLMTPLVARTIQLRVLTRVLKDFSFSKEFSHFVCLVARHGRLTNLKQIFTVLEGYFIRENHIFPVKIIAAKPLNPAELKAIKTLLAHHFGDHLQLTLLTDPKLISGYRIETDEKIFDASFQKQLHLIELNHLNSQQTS